MTSAILADHKGFATSLWYFKDGGVICKNCSRKWIEVIEHWSWCDSMKHTFVVYCPALLLRYYYFLRPRAKSRVCPSPELTRSLMQYRDIHFDDTIWPSSICLKVLEQRLRVVPATGIVLLTSYWDDGPAQLTGILLCWVSLLVIHSN